jgi:hypothetical protein
MFPKLACGRYAAVYNDISGAETLAYSIEAECSLNVS